MGKMQVLAITAIIAASVGLTACNIYDNPPILVAVSDTVGLSASGGASDQGADLTLGLKGRKVAVVPVTLTRADGGQAVIGIPQGTNIYKSHSVLATLTIDGAAVSPSASVEQVVAIGEAADKWADGRAKIPPPWAAKPQ